MGYLDKSRCFFTVNPSGFIEVFYGKHILKKMGLPLKRSINLFYGKPVDLSSFYGKPKKIGLP